MFVCKGYDQESKLGNIQTNRKWITHNGSWLGCDLSLCPHSRLAVQHSDDKHQHSKSIRYVFSLKYWLVVAILWLTIRFYLNAIFCPSNYESKSQALSSFAITAILSWTLSASVDTHPFVFAEGNSLRFHNTLWNLVANATFISFEWERDISYITLTGTYFVCLEQVKEALEFPPLWIAAGMLWNDSWVFCMMILYTNQSQHRIQHDDEFLCLMKSRIWILIFCHSQALSTVLTVVLYSDCGFYRALIRMWL